MEDKDLENQKSFRRFLTAKYLIDGGLVILVVASIVYCSYAKLINSEVTGTLMGAVIGYSLGGLRKIHEK